MSGVTERIAVRVLVVGLVVLALLGILVVRLWDLQVLAGDKYASESLQNHVRIVTQQAPRGRILDRNGVEIVNNDSMLVVGIRREEFRQLSKTRQLLIERKLGALLGMTPKQIEQRLRDKRPSPYSPIPIARNVPKEVVFALSERKDEFPDVEWSLLPMRRYPKGSLAAQTIGYVNEVSAKELKAHPDRFRLGDTIGRTGLERIYDSELRGHSGLRKIEVNAAGAAHPIGEEAAVPGDDIRLSLDAKVQGVAEDSLAQAIAAARTRVYDGTKKHFPAPAGALVVIDVNTGGVVAMASNPTFDLRRFVGGVSEDYFASLSDPNAHQPLLNRAIGEGGTSYPPGSTFKPLMAVASLGSGLSSYNGRYACTSEFKFGTGVFHNWRPENGSISLAQSLVESCDTVYYNFAKQWWLREDPVAKAGRAPYEAMQDYARRFGLGRVTGIDLQGETNGRIPDRAYRRAAWNANKAEYCRNYEKTKLPLWEDLCLRGFYWDGGDSVITSIGQGDVLATPLQMAVAYAALANGGRVLEPHLVSKIVTFDGKVIKTVKPVVRSTVRVSPTVLSYVSRALAGVPVHGTAQSVFAGWPLDRIPIAAKTGTSQITGAEPYSWFASFAPANGHPRYAVIAVVERAGFGAQVAGPVVRRVMDALFGRPLTRIAYGARSD